MRGERSRSPSPPHGRRSQRGRLSRGSCSRTRPLGERPLPCLRPGEAQPAAAARTLLHCPPVRGGRAPAPPAARRRREGTGRGEARFLPRRRAVPAAGGVTWHSERGGRGRSVWPQSHRGGAGGGGESGERPSRDSRSPALCVRGPAGPRRHYGSRQATRREGKQAVTCTCGRCSPCGGRTRGPLSRAHPWREASSPGTPRPHRPPGRSSPHGAPGAKSGLRSRWPGGRGWCRSYLPPPPCEMGPVRPGLTAAQGSSGLAEGRPCSMGLPAGQALALGPRVGCR